MTRQMSDEFHVVNVDFDGYRTPDQIYGQNQIADPFRMEHPAFRSLERAVRNHNFLPLELEREV